MPRNVANDLSTRVRETATADATVFVIDDDVSMRESLPHLIRTEGWQAETFASAEEFLASPQHTGPCCIVLDVRLPGLSGLDLQRQLVSRPDMPVIFVSGHGDVPMTVQAMKAGAVEFLTKPFKNQTMVDAIRDALDRSRVRLREHAGMKTLRASYASLTPREREVMALVVSGLLNKQVAAELGISEITVKAHRGRLMQKMNADSVPALVMMAATLRLSPKISVLDIHGLILPMVQRPLGTPPVALSGESPRGTDTLISTTRSSTRPAFPRMVQSTW